MVDKRRDAPHRVGRETGEAGAPLISLLVSTSTEVLYEGGLTRGIHTAYQAAKDAKGRGCTRAIATTFVPIFSFPLVPFSPFTL